MQTWITDAGLSKLAIAHANGLEIQITTFAVGIGTGTSGTATTALEGSVYGPVAVSAVRWVSDTTWEVDTEIPAGSPAAGSWALTEGGVYLEDGTLFAYTTFDVKTKETSSEMLLRWTFEIDNASPSDITVTGSAWTISFRGNNILLNSEFRAHGFGGMDASGTTQNFAYGDALQGWMVWDESETAGNLMKIGFSDALEVTSNNHAAPYFLIQDLPAELVESASGGNILLRVRALSAGTTPKIRIGFLFDRGLATEYLSVVDYTITGAFATYSASRVVPSGSPIVTSTISVVIAPLTADEYEFDWAICNLEDEEVYYVPTNVEQRVIEGRIVYPDITAAELQTVLDEATANLDTNEYAMVYLAPGVFNINANITDTKAVLAAIVPGETKIVLDDADVAISIRELKDIEVETGTITAATNPAITVVSMRGSIVVSGSRDNYLVYVNGGVFEDLSATNSYNGATGHAVRANNAAGDHLLAVVTHASANALRATGIVNIQKIDTTGGIDIDNTANLTYGNWARTGLSRAATVNTKSLGSTVSCTGTVAVTLTDLTVIVPNGKCITFHAYIPVANLLSTTAIRLGVGYPELATGHQAVTIVSWVSATAIDTESIVGAGFSSPAASAGTKLVIHEVYGTAYAGDSDDYTFTIQIKSAGGGITCYAYKGASIFYTIS